MNYWAVAIIGSNIAAAAGYWVYRIATRPGAREASPAPHRPAPNCCLPEDSYEDHLEHSQETSYTGFIQTDDEFLLTTSKAAGSLWCKVERILADSHEGRERMLLYSDRDGKRYWLVESEFRKIIAPYRPRA